MAIPRVLKDLLRLPTAPFVEHAVCKYVDEFCQALPQVTLTVDEWGNRLAHYRHKPATKARPLVFTAHMDHPGFVATRMRGDKELVADFRGWVESPYFVGTGVRFWSGGRWVKGEVREVLKEADLYRMIGRSARPEEVLVRVQRPVARNSPGMWDLPDPTERDGKVYARGCDDIAGVASLLALLERLSRANAAVECYLLFTRAEEVGFIGAIGAAKKKTIPRGLPVIAIETSKMLPNAPQGAGPVLRVGDKSSIFTPELTAFCERIAMKLRESKKGFQYQRKLMDGGTCESTAYLVYGYEATGICVSLGNYHNMNEAKKKIDSEYIDLGDWKNMVDWYEALVLDPEGYRPGESPQLKSLDERFAKSVELLKSTPELLKI